MTLAAGAFDLAQEDIAAVDVPATSPESMQLAGMLALSHSLVAAADSRPANVEAALEHAAELAARTGEGTLPTGWGSAPPMWACGVWRPFWRSGTTTGPRHSRRT